MIWGVGMRMRMRSALLAGAVVSVIAGLLVPTGAAAQSGARGVTATTIKVAGLGFADQLGDGSIGAQARFARANRDHELPGGRKIDYTEFADDKADPTTALSEARRLVQQEGVFAIVPTLSPNLGQGQFFDQQHVPYFGWGIAASYCHPGYGFAVSGCLLPENPTITDNNWARTITNYYNDTKKPKPWSVAIVNEDTPAGKTSTAIVLAQFQADGFKVTYAKPSMPGPPAVVGDFSPYVNAVLTSNNGKAPDLVVLSIGSTNAFAFVKALNAAGYKGDISLSFYDPRIVALLKDTIVITPFGPFESDAPAMKQLISDVKAFKPDVTLGLAVEAGYLSADMFIKAMQKVGKDPTPEKLQKVASTMTYKLSGVQCPTTFPTAWKHGTDGTGLVKSNGTTWQIVEPYTPVNTCAPMIPLKGHPKSI